MLSEKRASARTHLKKNLKTAGLRYWMERVLAECDNAASGFQPDPVHDLRVALRRCRSLADGMIAMDPDRCLLYTSPSPRDA